MFKEFYTVGEVAQMLGVTPYTVREWLKNGTLDGVKMGRLWRVPISAVPTRYDYKTSYAPRPK